MVYSQPKLQKNSFVPFLFNSSSWESGFWVAHLAHWSIWHFPCLPAHSPHLLLQHPLPFIWSMAGSVKRRCWKVPHLLWVPVPHWAEATYTTEPARTTWLKRTCESLVFCGTSSSFLYSFRSQTSTDVSNFPCSSFMKDQLSIVNPWWPSLIFISSQILKYQQVIRIYPDSQQHFRDSIGFKKLASVFLYLGSDLRSSFIAFWVLIIVWFGFHSHEQQTPPHF